MRYLFCVILLSAFMVPVYEGQSLVPSFYIQRTPGTDTYRVYDAKNPVVPKYTIRDDRIYRAGEPVVPISTIKKKGGGSPLPVIRGY